MSTVNGTGTMRFDWTRRPDGTADATLWTVFLYFPLVPLRREHVEVVLDETKPDSPSDVLLVLAGVDNNSRISVRVLGTVAMTQWSIVWTYLKSYLGIPFCAFLLPILLFAAVVLLLERVGIPRPDPGQTLPLVMGGWLLIYLGWLASRLLDGGQERRFVTRILKPSSVDQLVSEDDDFFERN